MYDKEEFEELVGRCRAEITEHLPEIAMRHSSFALLAALAEHVGGALRLFMQLGSATREEAQGVITRVERTAFSLQR